MPAVQRHLVYPLVVFTGVAVTVGVWWVLGLLVTPGAASAWWVVSISLSAGWLFAAWCVGDSRWARTAVPAFALNVFAWQHVAAHGLTFSGAALIIVAVAVGVLHVSSMRARTC